MFQLPPRIFHLLGSVVLVIPLAPRALGASAGRHACQSAGARNSLPQLRPKRERGCLICSVCYVCLLLLWLVTRLFLCVCCYHVCVLFTEAKGRYGEVRLLIDCAMSCIQHSATQTQLCALMSPSVHMLLFAHASAQSITFPPRGIQGRSDHGITGKGDPIIKSDHSSSCFSDPPVWELSPLWGMVNPWYRCFERTSI